MEPHEEVSAGGRRRRGFRGRLGGAGDVTGSPTSPGRVPASLRIVDLFLRGRLPPVLIAASLAVGTLALLATPREEEPQIVVPMADVIVEMPGASTAEMETRVTIPMEKKLAEIPGVEYLYSTTSPGRTLTIVRFYVGEKEEDSLVKLFHKLSANFDLIPPGASQPLIKPRSIDDVPILALTLWSARYDHYTLRRIAAQLDEQIKDVADVAETRLIGGQRRQIRLLLDPARMAAYRVDPGTIAAALAGANRELAVGSFAAGGREHLVDVGEFLRGADEARRLVVGARDGRPVYLADVARVEDGPEEVRDYVLFGTGPAAAHKGLRGARGVLPAVTLSVAKRKGANAVVVADRVLAKVATLRGQLVPGDVEVTVTRDYGDTAREKSNELLKHLLLATVSVTALIALFLGLRASLVVLVAIPVTLALTLFRTTSTVTRSTGSPSSP